MKCLKCGEKVLEFGMQFPNGSYTAKPGTVHRDYENDSDGQFMRCKHCNARNYTIDLPHKEGERFGKQFSHYKDN